MTEKLTENSPPVRLFENALRAAFNDGWTQGGKEYTTNRGGIPWSESATKRDAPARLAAEHERLVAERTAGLESRVKVLKEALEGIMVVRGTFGEMTIEEAISLYLASSDIKKRFANARAALENHDV